MPHSTSPIENAIELLDSQDSLAVREAFSTAHPADIADALEQLTPTKRIEAWQYIPKKISGKVLAELGEAVFKDLATEVEQPDLIESICLLDIDDIADLIPFLSEEVLIDVLLAVDADTRNRLGEVLSYPEDSAGGLMNIDVTVVRDNCSVEVALRFLRLKDTLPKQTDEIYLIDRNQRLTGILPTEKLLTASLNDPVKNHIRDNPVIFDCLTSKEEVARAFTDYDLISSPVIDENKRLIGRITIDDVVDVIRDAAEHDIMASAGLQDETDIFAPVVQTSRNRAVWLGVNLITALIGSWVIGQFEGSIQQLVALAVLMPIVASMGGNAGTQTLTVMIRGMSIGTIASANTRTVLLKEALVGVLNGLLWAAVIALIATLWYNDIELGIVIALAMVTNLIMAALAGVIIPIILEKLNIDPALAGGVALTTVTDVVGYFSVLGLATWFLL